MNRTQAVTAYLAFADKRAKVVNEVVFVQNTNDRMAVLKGVAGERLALVIGTKHGFTIDLVKKLHS